ncbi:peptidylprolyl isomerase [Marispirochaeta aestuarii]|uniref:peptidylprolyl isomerase n=1 Tax=Marispirochaeta aestuarii TaxID=1963862 RepID=UPI0029C8BD7B|nr:peptidylprolyl isomerase [Marispirochaeta aestuarii]
MKRYTLIIFSVLAAFVFLATCSGNGGASSSLKITADELDREVQKTVSQYEAQGMKVSEEQKAQLREAVLTQMVERKLLLHEAEKSGVELDQEKFETEFASIKTNFPTDEAFAQALSQRGYTEEMFKAEMAEIMTLQAFLEEEISSKIELGEEEMQAFYNENPEYFATEESVTASHILIEVNEDADEAEEAEAYGRMEEIAARVAAGEDFAELAREYSEGPSAPRGGDLGSFQRGSMVQVFEDTAFALEPGGVSDIIRTEFGFHIIKLTDRSEGGTLSFEDARDAIETYLRQEKEQEAVTAYVQELKEKYTVETPEG